MAVTLKMWHGRATTTGNVLVTAAAGEQVCLTHWRIVSWGPATCWFKAWSDYDGTVYDGDSLVWPEQSFPTNKIVSDAGLVILGPGGNLKVQAQANDSITVFLSGLVRT